MSNGVTQDQKTIPDDEMGLLERIQSVLEEWLKNKPSAFFIISLSDKQNVYVQGTKINGVIVVDEANQKHTKQLSDARLRGLIELGWRLDDDLNIQTKFEIESIISGDLSKFLYVSLCEYNLLPIEIDFTYTIDD